MKHDPGEIPEVDLVLSPLHLDSQFVDMRAFVGLDPHGTNPHLINPRTAVALQSPVNRPGTSTTPSRSAGDDSSKSNAPALGVHTVDEGANSVRDKDGNTVLEIYDSSISNQEEGQGRESDKGDGDEEVDKEQGEEMSGSQANPSENPLEVHGSETTPRVESVAADQLVNADPPEPSVNDEAVA